MYSTVSVIFGRPEKSEDMQYKLKKQEKSNLIMNDKVTTDSFGKIKKETFIG